MRGAHRRWHGVVGVMSMVGRFTNGCVVFGNVPYSGAPSLGQCGHVAQTAAPPKAHHLGSKKAQDHLFTPHSANDTAETLPPAPHRIPYADSHGAVDTPQPRTRSAPTFNGPLHDLRRARGGPTAFPSPASGWTRTEWRIQRRQQERPGPKHSAAQQITNVVSRPESGKQSPPRTHSRLPCYRPHATPHTRAQAHASHGNVAPPRPGIHPTPSHPLASITDAIAHRPRAPHSAPAARPSTLDSSHPLPPPPHATRPLPLSTYQHVGKVVLGPIENPQPHNRAHGGAGAGLPLGHSGRRPPAKRAAAAGGVRRRWAGHAAERQRGRGWREGVYSEEKRKKRTQTNTALDMVLFVEGKVGEGERQRHRGPQTSSGGGRGVCTDRGGFAE